MNGPFDVLMAYAAQHGYPVPRVEEISADGSEHAARLKSYELLAQATEQASHEDS